MNDRHLQTELEELRRKVVDIEGPIRESIEQIKNSLVGTPDGSNKGLLPRVLILEIQVSELLTTAADLQRQQDTANQKLNDIKSNCVKHAALTENLKNTEDKNAQDRIWLRNLIWGTAITGLVALIVDWALHRLGLVK